MGSLDCQQRCLCSTHWIRTFQDKALTRFNSTRRSSRRRDRSFPRGSRRDDLFGVGDLGVTACVATRFRALAGLHCNSGVFGCPGNCYATKTSSFAN